jgi:CheY-like chemotaxis protein
MYKPSIDFSKLRILVVENHALMRRLLGEMLRGFGVVHMSFARDVPGAVDYIYGEDFDVVILDFFLGELDGADFAKHIRHDGDCRNREVPILLITGMPDHHKVMKVLDAGINGMLAKPIAPKDLYHRIFDMLARPKPFVISSDYVGPMRSRKKPPVSRKMRPAAFNSSAPAKKPRGRVNHAYEDGILL